jgi:hypothetical protein
VANSLKKSGLTFDTRTSPKNRSQPLKNPTPARAKRKEKLSHDQQDAKEIFRGEKLETLLMTRWTEFMDPAALTRWVASQAEKTIDANFILVSQEQKRKEKNQITASHFRLDPRGLLAWIDFELSLTTFAVSGTAEVVIGDAGVSLCEMSGVKQLRSP